jgi:TolA-binding protein/Tfp pilus assembly protein PilN
MKTRTSISPFFVVAAGSLALLASPMAGFAAKAQTQALGMRAPRSSNLVIQTAAAAQKAKGSSRGTAAAPTLEDYADYFSTDRGGSSRVDLRKADEIRVKTIASIKKLLGDRKDKSGRNFELILRLGELYVERHDYIRDLEAEAFSRAYADWQAKPEKSRGAEPRLTYKIANAELTKAAMAFRRLVSEYPRHPRTDSALFALAKALGRLGDDNAESYFNQLIKSWPKSQFVPDAQLALGELYFDKNNMTKAMQSYKACMQFKDHPAYPYAVYKLGWVYFNSASVDPQQSEDFYKKSITAFKLVIKLASSPARKGNLDLRKEALKDLVLVWAETEDVDGAWKYFRTIGEEGAFYAMLERLGGIYAEQGKQSKAIEVYERLVREAPSRPSTPEIYATLVELNDTSGREADAAAKLRMMPALFTGNTKWTAANSENQALVKSAATRTEKMLHRWGALYHNRGQKSKNPALVAIAATIYETYLQNFAQSEAAYEIRFYLAEIQFDQKRLEPSAVNYSIVANSRPKDGKFKRAAALNAVAAMNKLVEETKFDALPPAGKATREIEIPREKLTLVKYMDDYSRLLPTDAEGYPMRYSAAQVFFDHGHYDDALKRFEEIVKTIPGTQQGKASAKIIIAFHFEKGRWTDVIAWAKRIDGIPEFKADANMQATRNSLYSQALFNRGTAWEKSGDFAKAATDFLAFQKEFPADQSADRALFNASLNLEKASMLEDSMETAKKLIEAYPKSSLRPDAMARLGDGYEALADLAAAAKWYAELGLKFPADKRSATALYNAAILQKAIGRLDIAESLLTEIRRMHSTHEIAREATMELASVQERRERYVEAATTLAALAGMRGIDPDTQILAMVRKAKILALHLKDAAGRYELDRLRNSLARKDAPPALQARQELASTLFEQVETGFTQFMAAKVSSGRTIENQIQAKQGILERVAAGYESVIAIGSPEFTVASLYRLGEMHEDFAEKLFSVQPGTDLNQKQALTFRSKMDKLAFPLREEAGKFFEVAQKRSSEVETFSDWTERIEVKMAELSGRKESSEAMMVLAPQYASQKFALNKSTRELID